MPEDLRRALAHVIWIGGGTDSGKSTIAERVAHMYSAQLYWFDRHEMDHFRRADPDRHPALWAAHPDRMGPEERWLGSPPSEMARETVACWTERFWMAVDDLLVMSRDTPIVAEGPGLFPDCVAPLLTRRSQAVWLVPDEAFKRASVYRRGKLKDVPVSDVSRAIENLIQRDLLMNQHIRERAAALDVLLIEVDGTEDVDAMTARVFNLLRAGGE